MDNGGESTMVPSTDPSTAAEVTPAADSESAAGAPRESPTLSAVATPPPPASHCLGARGYDGGFHDVGSFFVFQHESLRQQQLAKDGGADLELFGAAPTGSCSSLPTPLQYKLLDGLRVKVNVKVTPALGGVPMVEGRGSEVAGRAFEVLQRQVNFMGQALVGCSAGTADASQSGADSMHEHEAAAAAANGSSADANGGTGNDAAGSSTNAVMAGEANGKLKPRQPPPRPAAADQGQELFALSNTEDNESIQGLVRSGGYLWVGSFGLPPAQPGEDESEMVDLWPRSVARLSERGKGAIVPLEGTHDAVGPLTAPKEHSGGGEEALKTARRTHGLLVQALAELRPHMPPPSEREEDTALRSPSLQPAGSGKAGASASSSTAGPCDEGTAERAMSVADSEVDTEEETSAAAGGRRGRKRARVEGAAAAAAGAGGNGSYNLRGREAGDGGGSDAAKENNDYSEEGEEEEEEGGGAGGKEGLLSAGEMTVAAVRGSLLRNRSDEPPPPNPEVEEWESAVKSFVLHVESLPPGTAQEELSLMFAAALDPTLVRMRNANTSLVKLAEACASPSQEEEGDPAGGGGGGLGDSAAKRRKNGFNVFLELEAAEGGAAPAVAPPPPAGIAAIRRAVAAAAAAIEAVARAEACIVHAGDTLGGLAELKTDYRRSLPLGPREPIQFIIAEEQARVLGYVSAHKDILSQRMEGLRAAGAKVGDAYRSAEQEAGWSGGVKVQVEAYLVELEEYCRSLVSSFKPGSDFLGMGVDLGAAAARNGNAAPADDDAAGGMELE